MCLYLSACCCCSLEVGAQIISIATTMLSAVTLVLYSSAALMLDLPPTRTIFYGAVSVVSGFQLIFGCLLSYGVFSKKPSYMWPWLILSWFVSVVLLAMSAMGVALLVYWGSVQESTEVNSMITLYSVYAMILLYFAMVVNSRRDEMKREASYKSVVLRPVNSWKYV